MNENNKNNFTEEDERIMQERMLERRKLRAEQKRREEEKKLRQKQKRKKLVFAGKIALCVIVALSLLFIAARSLGNVTFSKAADYIAQSISNLKPGDGYPVEVGSGTVSDMQSLGDCIALLKDDSVLLLNSTAKEIAKYQHSFSKPVLEACDGRFILMDRTTGRFFIADSSDILFEDKLEAEVYCCALGESGNFAFSCTADNASSILKVFNSKYESEFDFKCANEYIIAVSLSKNGKYAALIGIGSSNASIYSKIYLIDIENQEVIKDFTFNGTSLHSINYCGKDTVVAVSDSGNYYVIENDAENSEIVDSTVFSNTVISAFKPHRSGNFTMALTKYGSIDSDVLALFDSNGREKFSVETNANIDCLDFDGKSICFVSSDNVLYSYSSSGKLIGKTELEMNAQRIAVSGKYCYALCYGELMRYDVKTDIE